MLRSGDPLALVPLPAVPVPLVPVPVPVPVPVRLPCDMSDESVPVTSTL